MSELDPPCRGTIVTFEGESGTIEVENQRYLRFGRTACSGFEPEVGLAVWVMALKVLPIVGPRATLVNLTGRAEAESAEERVRIRIERELAAPPSAFRIDEALPWLERNPDGFAADRFAVSGSAAAFVRELMAHGARVALVGSDREPQSGEPEFMEVEIPTDAHARRSLFACFEREWNAHSDGFAVEPDGREARELTREEATALGDPEAEGQSVSDGGPPRDVGQPLVMLWWD